MYTSLEVRDKPKKTPTGALVTDPRLPHQTKGSSDVVGENELVWKEAKALPWNFLGGEQHEWNSIVPIFDTVQAILSQHGLEGLVVVV